MQNSESSGPWRPLRRLRRWYFKTPERALDAAYRAALAIQELEQEYFQGQMMTPEGGYTGLEWGQLKSERDRNLDIIQRRLREFRASRSTLNWITRSSFRTIPLQATDASKSRYSPDETYQFSENLKKLKVIDEIAGKYLRQRPSAPRTSQPLAAERSPNPSSQPLKESNSERNPPLGGSPPSPRFNRGATNPSRNWRDDFKSSSKSREETASDVESISGQASLLPRSILRTLNRIKEELDPNAEEDVVEKFRYYKSKTVVSLKFILLLILVPLLTHQVSKNFIIRPIYNEFFPDTVDIFINSDFEEEAYQELRHYEERLRFRMAIGSAPPLSDEEFEETVNEEAQEIARKFQAMSNNALQNVAADLCSFGAFILVLMNSKREIAIVKSFIDDLIYGLSDSAKAFIIILFTDIFVGYHSPHGWEIILEGVSHHFGLPESRDFNFMFIATFPVILDTVMKYWIFRYLNRISPSAVATYRNMNE
ncbi:MAG: proton extrusion protein PcxA [Phormidium sp. BM_Day4_Bin.17]|nr:proton extrusion protein PcxA [Phormidium sp. BM_Day4_Bin.17]UCJ11409.1 MAG: proton extrusion protein PcxA [Phormidium sp. PBR-2020]